MNQMLRKIPPVHELLNHPSIQSYMDNHQLISDVVKEHIQSVLESIRQEIQLQKISFQNRDELTNYIVNQSVLSIQQFQSPNIRPVINATGTVLHTNLGRARLPESAVKKVLEVAENYSTLEYDHEKGTRGSRHDLVEDYIKELTGAESAIVVNNNAASVYMVLSAFAKSKETIVSRGELVEIGGSFRVSSIMEESGAILKEIGTTNKTHPYDYEQAINDQTAMLMKVHTSNFHMLGFTKQVSREELVTLGKEHQLMVYEDLGSGMLYDLTSWGIGSEPTIQDVISSGIDLVSFSGDKLLGGPQVGVIAGKKKYIDQLKKHQLARVLRVDKLSYAALEETFKTYFYNRVTVDNPTIRDIVKTKEEILQQVNEVLHTINSNESSLVLKGEELLSQVGGGTLPEVQLESYGISIMHHKHSAEKIHKVLRQMNPPMITRIEHEKVILDFRTISPHDSKVVLQHLEELTKTLSM
ncbi:L-seryl-tRNA(Sec) selenium transferase [Aquisalibacillus elongatus]|uniref:L-seryl-tRNA(Sec) selenium transferase n=1 Tax=Aquisalibacillus elongatus TaxID=485577 RepID=A0A3N5CF25_9BACI|nr:L-seryl-tRNA(Sec) selenium transferase [Aquisalibacillus elongatus]RPF55891.1 L-seryl-tRNA(Sec) selenium transferase [Aquisalibacillus elongatus]